MLDLLQRQLLELVLVSSLGSQSNEVGSAPPPSSSSCSCRSCSCCSLSKKCFLMIRIRNKVVLISRSYLRFSIFFFSSGSIHKLSLTFCGLPLFGLIVNLILFPPFQLYENYSEVVKILVSSLKDVSCPSQ